MRCVMVLAFDDEAENGLASTVFQSLSSLTSTLPKPNGYVFIKDDAETVEDYVKKAVG